MGYLQYINHQMVNLHTDSVINASKYPNIQKWDATVRTHYQKYQRFIDAHTYRLQRIQRGIMSLPYPKFYNTELLSLQVLRKKQQVGQVQQAEVNLYKNIDPCIATHFNRTFNSGFNLPKLGLLTGGALGAFSIYFNFSIPTRFVLTALPIAIDWIRVTRDAKNEQHSLNFLNWVVGYRKAKCFAELHKGEFNGQATRVLLGDNNLIQFGNELIRLANK